LSPEWTIETSRTTRSSTRLFEISCSVLAIVLAIDRKDKRC
jgi:hypothetical protein